VNNLPTELDPDANAVVLKEHHFLSEDHSSASFLLENRSSKAILSFTLILEYRTTTGNHGLSIVYEGQLDGQKDASDRRLPAESVDLLRQPIAAKGREWISGQSPYILPDCPSSARLTMLDINYVDHSNFRWSTVGWRTMPLLSEYPDYLAIPDSRIWKDEYYYFLAQVDRGGRLKVVTPFPPTTNVPSDSVQDGLKRFSFSPTLRDDVPEEATILLIVQFHWIRGPNDPRKTVTPKHETSRVAVLIDLAPRNSLDEDWYFYYGGGRGYKTTRPSLREE
jgi:hypothetical protein